MPKEKGNLKSSDKSVDTELSLNKMATRSSKQAMGQTEGSPSKSSNDQTYAEMGHGSPGKTFGLLSKLIRSPFKRSKSLGDEESKANDPKSADLSPKQTKQTSGSGGEIPDQETLSSVPPPILTLTAENREYHSMIEAINSLQATMVESHLNLERKIDTRLTSLEGHLQKLNDKIVNQDKAISDLRGRMVDKNNFQAVEESLRDIASQADEKFQEIDHELTVLRRDTNAYYTENLRLKYRLAQVEEKISLQTIRAKKYVFLVEGIPESKDENLRTVLTDKINPQGKDGFTQDDIVTVYRQGCVA